MYPEIDIELEPKVEAPHAAQDIPTSNLNIGAPDYTNLNVPEMLEQSPDCLRITFLNLLFRIY